MEDGEEEEDGEEKKSEVKEDMLRGRISRRG